MNRQAPSGLALDARQRAMLQEMQVRVWTPLATGPGAAADAHAPGAAPAVARATALGTASTRNDSTPVQPPLALPTLPTSEPAGERGTPRPDSATDWQALQRAVSECAACGLCAGRKAAVFQTEAVHRQADWLVVGEPPDENEERAGAPFVAQAGQLLDAMLRSVGVARDGMGSAGARLSNVVKCRPAKVRNPQPDELALCAAHLQREIALVQPRLILAMGRFAAQSLLEAGGPDLAAQPFDRLRGQVHRYLGLPVVVTYHPVHLLRMQENKAKAWADLCLAQGLARRSET